MRADLRLAWLLTRGSDRQEWWRVTLTAVGALLATGFALGAVVLGSLQGQYSVSFGGGLLGNPSNRSGVIIALVLLLVPVLGFLGQCARIGAVHRDRRLAALRLAGATSRQVRRITALEAGLTCLVGSAVGTVFCVLMMLRVWTEPTALAWAGITLVTFAVPALGALVSALSLRRVVSSPLGWVRRVRPTRRPGRSFLVGALLIMVLTLPVFVSPYLDMGRGRPIQIATAPLLVFALVLVTGVGAVWLSGASARLVGRRLAARTEDPAVLIAAERLRDDPWAGARTHAAVLLVTVVGMGFMGIQQMFLDAVHHPQEGLPYDPEYVAFYTTGVNLAGAAVLVALVISLSGLAVGTAESLATRRRGLAAQAAVGVPQKVLGRALLLETALPLAPAMLLAGIGGTAVYIAYGVIVDARAIPILLPLLVPVAVYTACLLAAATSLPLLRRSVRPGELRYT
ncbi:FtsX-like permease family protein [Streptomyces yerevanensis]|uniref:FtsX-like permease family protein n=1 Tax=Streptomyces yerevanensis TaxID=66378 RepID=UPI00052798EC|nr:FtsX-like permease family protein [Streptomyces yerevanensis]